MNRSRQIEGFWQDFRLNHPEIAADQPYEVWFFHHNRESAARLVQLVLSGKKTATASLAEEGVSENGFGGIVGGYSVVTDFDDNPKCVIQTTEVRRLRFDKVDAEFAYDEGEGDQTLDYWRSAHRRFFIECCRETGTAFDESMLICCKRFKLLFPKL